MFANITQRELCTGVYRLKKLNEAEIERNLQHYEISDIIPVSLCDSQQFHCILLCRSGERLYIRFDQRKLDNTPTS